MKTTKVRRPSKSKQGKEIQQRNTFKWESLLRRHLAKTHLLGDINWFQGDLFARKMSSRERCALISRATEEIIKGIRFLTQKDLPVTSSVLSDNFNIGNRCCCLLAKAKPHIGEFDGVRDMLGLTLKETGSLGLSYLRQRTVLQLHPAIWEEVYNLLWKKAGRFFRDHPELTKGIPSLQP